MNPPDEKTLARMKKLLELARRGVGGEAANAARFLESLLARHGMTLDDIVGETQQRKRVRLKWATSYEYDLLLQILSKVLDSWTIEYWPIRGKKIIQVELTAAEHAEVVMHQAALVPAIKKHLETAKRAFMEVHDLYPSTKDRDAPGTPLSPAEIEALLQMMKASKRVPIHKALPGAST